MSPEDRELLQLVRRQQLDLQRMLARLDAQIEEIEARANGVTATPAEIIATESSPEFPPVPPSVNLEPPPLPPMPEEPQSAQIPSFLLEHEPPHLFPPFPVETEPGHPLPPLPPPGPGAEPAISTHSFEFRLGRWIIGFGAVLFVISLVTADSYFQLHNLLGPGGKVGLGGLISVLVIMLGQFLERKKPALLFLARAFVAMGLAGLYVSLYAACSFEPMRVIHSPFRAGLVLLSWSVYVFYLAHRSRSQSFAIFAITLAYFSTAINPIGHFTMAADLLLAVTAVVFLIRNGWATLSYFSLAGTYYAMLRRLLVDDDGDVAFDISRTIHFWPNATYLMGAWLIFTSAVILSTSPTFRGGKRLAFLSLNNGALAGLLLLTTFLSGYGHGPMGWVLLATGFVLLLASRFAGWVSIEPERVMRAYAAQGLAAITFGIMVLFTGITRGLVLLIETLFLGLAASFAGDLVLVASTYVAAFFATLFLIQEIAINAHHPWLLGFGGAAVMLLNAWWARSEIRDSPMTRTTIVLPCSYYCTLAIGLIFTALYSEMSDNYLPPALAFAALALTFSIYFVELFELPPLAQVLLFVAQLLVLFPADHGESLPWWTTAWVAIATLVMLTWWSRQQITRSGSWVIALNLVYALALAGLTYETVRPELREQSWMICAALLSVAFLIWGAFARIWSLAVVSQLFLAVSVYHFFAPPSYPYPWNWLAATVPIMVVFSTARALHAWLRLYPEATREWLFQLKAIGYGYKVLSLLMLIRWVTAVIPTQDQVPAFLLLGTLIFVWNVKAACVFGIRCSFVLSFAGLWVFGGLLEAPHPQVTFLEGLGFLGFLVQSGFLRRSENTFITRADAWALILVSAAAGWLFVCQWTDIRFSSAYLTLAWALYAGFLYLLGLFTKEERQRWCGLAVLVVSIARVFIYDFWSLPAGYKVLTFLAMTIITLGFGYLILRNADRTKK